MQEIQAWWQRIEDSEAQSARRTPRAIDEEQAVQKFRQALLADIEHSEPAKDLLRELIQPTQPKITVVEAWKLQDPTSLPASPTPEQQAYIDQYDQWERESRKWDIELSPQRQSLMCQLERENRWTDWERELGKAYEEWMLARPELTAELIQALTNGWSGPRLPDAPQEQYHSSGLFWLVANVLLKVYGFDDRVAEPIIRRLRDKWKRFDDDVVTIGLHSGYLNLIQHLAKVGAHQIQQLDRYLLRTVRNEIKKVTKAEDCLVNQVAFEELDDKEPVAPPSDSPDVNLLFLQLRQSLPNSLRRYADFALANPDAIDHEAAKALGCSTRTIERARQKLRHLLKP